MRSRAKIFKKILDLQKPFDTVDHDILCKKLKIMDIKSVDWFRSYLSIGNQICQCE